MQVTEQSAASKAEQVARSRPAVERWLTWSGLVPLPVFLVLHLSTELYRSFASDVGDLVRAAPTAFELVTLALLVWAPLCVHAALGVWLMCGRHEARAVDVARLPRALSRAWAIVALAFLIYHTCELTGLVWLGAADARDLGFLLVAKLSSTRGGVPLHASAYLLGLLATLAHAGLSTHRGLLAEGLLPTPAKRQRSARACAVLATLLFGMGALAVIRVASGALLH